ncbi:hypothetical protein GF322_00630 [Candidatus Dependentiae bacterium]|nr:hypothetical protein [Candidatus Dependentiae bacterium]
MKSILVVLFKIFILFNTNFLIQCKQIVFQGESSVIQTSYQLQSEKIIFTKKYQNINGRITQSWFIGNQEVAKDEYFEKLSQAEKEEQEIIKEEENKRKAEQARLKREKKELKKKEEESFYKRIKLNGLKKMINLEVAKIENKLKKLDEYSLDEYFVFEEQTFDSFDSLQDIRIGLLNKAKSLVLSDIEVLDFEDLKGVLKKLEVFPKKIEIFFRKSVKNAIDKCEDTKRLKDLLALI